MTSRATIYRDWMQGELDAAFPMVEWTLVMQGDDMGTADGRDRRDDPMWCWLVGFNARDGVDISVFAEGVEIEGEGPTVAEARDNLGLHAQRLVGHLLFLGVLPLPTTAEADEMGFAALTKRHLRHQQRMGKTLEALQQRVNGLDDLLDTCRALTKPKG